MEDKDLKSAIKQIKEKKKRETLERIIIFLSGLLLTLVFIAVGLNYYSKSDKTVSEPQVKVVAEANKPPTPPPPAAIQTTPPVENNQPQQPAQQETSLEPENQQKEEVKKSENMPSQPQPTQKVEQTKKEPEKQPEKQQIVSQSKSESEKHVEKQKETHKETVKKEPEKTTVAKTIEAKKETKQEQKANSKNDENITKEIVEKIKSGYFSIQVGAFSTREKAEVERSKYSNAFIIEEGGLHKVLVGKFPTEKEAREYQKQHDIKGFIKRVGS
ncbi:MAG: SPOR domain-containing protein [Sulfurihydrogenibium sp.]|uniref:SPOR domain-containing protein n=1 Tax=Sulfurihydrogenibium sp. TaxID=2053621 RepID=UPI003D148237